MEGLPWLGRLCTTGGLLKSYNNKNLFSYCFMNEKYMNMYITVSLQCNMLAKSNIASGAYETN